jgi:hypothetical protein
MRWLALANYVRCNSFPEERRKEAVACYSLVFVECSYDQ